MITVCRITYSIVDPSKHTIFAFEIGQYTKSIKIVAVIKTLEEAKIWCDIRGYKVVEEELLFIQTMIDNIKENSLRSSEEIFFDLVKEGKIHLL